MRIAVDIRALRNNTGVTRYLRSLLETLQIIDTQNDYLLLHNGGQKIAFKESPRWRVCQCSTALPGTLWLQVEVPALLKKEKVDLFWGDQSVPLLVAPGLKRVLSIFDLTYKHFPKTMSRTVSLTTGFLIPAAMRKADHVITISHFIRDDILRSFKNRIEPSRISVASPGKPDWTIPGGYDASSRSDHLLFIGNLEPRKNLVRLIAALELLKARGLEAKLHLVGPTGWRNRSLHDMIRSSPVSNQIVCRGFLPDSELQREYLHCKAFVYPSLYEGFGIPVLEALALDCPVITSGNSSMQEIAGAGAIYCDPYSVESIASAIASVYSTSFNRSELMSHAPAILAKYSWESSALKVLSAFERVAADGTGRAR